MVRVQKTRLVLAIVIGLTFCAPTPLTAAEKKTKVQLQSSTTIELPRPRDFEFKRPNAKDVDKPSIDGDGFLSPPPPTTTPLLNNELKKLQDKRDNWIFMRPEEIL